MSSKHDRIRKTLEERAGAIVDDWYEAIKAPSLAVRSPSETRQLLAGLLERIFAFLLEEGGDPAEARAIGTAFVQLRLGPEAFGRVQGALAKHLLPNLPAQLMETLCPRLAALVEGLAAGFIHGDRTTLLEQQEEIRTAYARSLRLAEVLVTNAGVEGAINAIAVLDLDGKITYVNPAFVKTWGYSGRHEVIGRHVSGFGEWRGDVRRALEILSAEGGWVGELVAVRANGSRFDVRASVSGVRDRAGHPTHLMAFFVDITKRRQAQAALERRASQLAMLNQIGETIAALLAPYEVLETAVRLVQESFDYHQVALLTVDREHGDLVVAAIAGAFEGDAPDMRRLPFGRGITGWVARHGETLVVGEVGVDPRYVELSRREVPTRSELAVPIESGSGVIGVLDVQSPRPDAFSDADRIALETVADQIAVALENARLYEALQNELAQRARAEDSLRRNVQRLETLHEIDQAILVARSIEEVAESALRHLRRLVPCQMTSIYLLNFEAGELTELAAIPVAGEGVALTGSCFPLTEPEYLRSMLKQRPYACVRDIRQLPDSSPFVRAARDAGIQSFLGAAIRSRGELIGVLALGADRVDGFEPGQGPIVEEVADSVAVAIRQAYLLESVQEQGERLRDTMARLAEAEEAERRRVVQTLHDRVGQNLTALGLNLSLVQTQLRDRDLHELSSHLDGALSLLERTNERIRRLMAELRPPVLDDYGLLATLRWYAREFSSRMGIEVTVCGEQEASGLPAHVENALFRIAQEALHNMAKHAEATEATIELSAREAEVRLTISDNGIGFEPKEERGSRSSWGLLTMKERAESVGAQCHIQSEPDRGTRVVVEVPR
jgi:PAS domain S-box-containing protein